MFCVKKRKKPVDDYEDPLEKLKTLMGQQETIEKEKETTQQKQRSFYFFSTKKTLKR